MSGGWAQQAFLGSLQTCRRPFPNELGLLPGRAVVGDTHWRWSRAVDKEKVTLAVRSKSPVLTQISGSSGS